VRQERLASRVSFILGIEREAWELLVCYLCYIRKHGKMEVVCLRERGDAWEYWMRNGLSVYVMEVWFGRGHVKLSQVCFDGALEKQVKKVLASGSAIRRGTFLRILRRVLWENRQQVQI